MIGFAGIKNSIISNQEMSGFSDSLGGPLVLILFTGTQSIRYANDSASARKYQDSFGFSNMCDQTRHPHP